MRGSFSFINLYTRLESKKLCLLEDFCFPSYRYILYRYKAAVTKTLRSKLASFNLGFSILYSNSEHSRPRRSACNYYAIEVKLLLLCTSQKRFVILLLMFTADLVDCGGPCAVEPVQTAALYCCCCFR